MSTTTATPPVGTTVTYASFGARFLALIIDWVVISVLQSLLIVPLLGAIGFSMAPALQNPEGLSETEAAGMLAGMMAAMGSMWIISICVSLLYFGIMESSKTQGTLGKMALSIKVTDLNGDRISFGKSILRQIGKYISGMILLIGYLLAAFTEKKQALHDMIASTLVLKK